jgi:hypothetical protein
MMPDGRPATPERLGPEAGELWTGIMRERPAGYYDEAGLALAEQYFAVARHAVRGEARSLDVGCATILCAVTEMMVRVGQRLAIPAAAARRRRL